MTQCLWECTRYPILCQFWLGYTAAQNSTSHLLASKPTSGSFFQTWPLIQSLPPSFYSLRLIYPVRTFVFFPSLCSAHLPSCHTPWPIYLVQEIRPPLWHLWIARITHLLTFINPNRPGYQLPTIPPFLKATSSCHHFWEWHVPCNDTLSMFDWLSDRKVDEYLVEARGKLDSWRSQSLRGRHCWCVTSFVLGKLCTKRLGFEYAT